MLFHSPHGKGGGTIRTGSATASVIGTTIIITATPNGGFKLLDLEGQAEVRYLSGLNQTLQPGQMTFVLPAGSASPIVVFRLDAETKGSALVSGFNTPLDSTSKINSEITQQLLQILNGAAADTGLIVGDNATPTTVQVVMDINNNPGTPPSTPPTPTLPTAFNSDGSIIGSEPVSSLPVNYPSLDSGHLVLTPFSIFPDSITPQIFPFLTAAGFVGRTIDIDTPNIDMSPFSEMPQFDFMAADDMRIWQSLTFSGSLPAAITLDAGGALSIAEGATVKADASGFLWLGAGSFNTLDTEDGSIEFANTLDDVTIMNCVGDLDLVSGSDLTLQDGSYLFAGGLLSLTVDGNFDLSGGSELNADGDVDVETEGGGTLTIGGRSGGIITAGGSIELLSGADIEIYNRSSLTANGGDVTIIGGGDVSVYDSTINARAGNVDIESTGGELILGVDDDVTINAAGNVTLSGETGADIEFSTVNAGASESEFGGSITVNGGGGNILISESTLSASDHESDFGGDVTITAGGNVDIIDSSISGDDGVTVTAGGCIKVLDSFDSSDLSMEDWDVEAGTRVDLTADGDLDIFDSTIYADDGKINISASGTVSIDDTTIEAFDGRVCITDEGTISLSSGDTFLSGFNIEVDSSGIYADSGNLTITDGGSVSFDSEGTISIDDESANYNNISISDDSTLYASDALSIVDNGDFSISGNSVDIFDFDLTLNKICIIGSTLTADEGDLSIENNGDVSISGEETASVSIDDSTISANNISATGSTLTSDEGDVSIVDNGDFSISAGSIDISDSSDLEVNNISVNNSTLRAFDSDVSITDNGYFSISGDDNANISIDDVSVNANNISIFAEDSTISAGGGISIVDNGTAFFSGGYVDIDDSSDLELNNISISGYTLTADDGDVSVADNGSITISGDDTGAFIADSRLSGNNISGDSTISASGGVSIVDNGVVTISGTSVNISSSTLDVNNISISGSLTANDGNVSIMDNGSITISSEDDAFVSGSTVSGNNITIASSTLTAYGGDVDVSDNGQVTSPLDIPISDISANNILISDSTLNAFASLEGVGGNVNISGNGGVEIDNSTIHADANVNITAEQAVVGDAIYDESGGVTISGGSITAGSTTSPKSIVITANGAAGTTINNGASLNAYYISVNSPDGILIDGTGGTVSGNHLNLTAADGNSDGGPTTTLQNGDFSQFAIINIRSHTVNLLNDDFSRGSIINIGTYYGVANVENGIIAGDANFIGDSYGGTRITSASQIGNGIGTTAGIFVHQN